MTNRDFQYQDPDIDMTEDEAALAGTAFEAEALEAGSSPAAMPSFLQMSGLYKALGHPSSGNLSSSEEHDAEDEDTNAESAEAGGAGAPPFIFEKEKFRLDVDRRYPQMTASGTLRRRFVGRVHWIAKLTPKGPSTWDGTIWYKDGNVAMLPHTKVKITAIRSFFPNRRKAIVRFKGGAPTRVRTFRFVSRFFHKVEFEYDREAGSTKTLKIATCAHPNRPPAMPCENLSIEKVYRRSGMQAKRSPDNDVIPTDGPDPNTTWSDAEMHDAMQTYWSRFANKPQWALWVLFAKRHDMGSGLGGIMFDDIGPNHRQGPAIFTNSFISNAPAGDPDPAAWVKRNHFWTAVHEMGHAFNLAHSWQKELGPPWGTPWIPLVNEPEARSFMNYPYSVAGGQSAFFADFEFRFSDGELLFMRHAPARFVQMGNADWFDHHGFQDAEVQATPDFSLEVGIDRAKPIYEFLEPVVIELKVTNVSDEPKIVPASLLLDTDHMAVILKKDGKKARRWAPYATYCRSAEKTVLNPGESMTESHFVSAGRNGWDLAEPGLYDVQMAMEIDGSDVVSNRLRLRVTPPKSFDEEYLAQDVFTEDAGRVMAFDGSMVLDAGADAWREVVAKLPKSRAAIHARIALALPLTRDYRVLRIDAPPEAVALGGRGAFAVSRKQPDEGRQALNKALLDDPETAIQTLGRDDYEYYSAGFRSWLTDAGDKEYAKKVGEVLEKAVAAVEGRAPAKAKRAAKKAKV